MSHTNKKTIKKIKIRKLGRKLKISKRKTPKTISPVILPESKIEECKQRNQLQIKLKETRYDLERKKEKCDEKIYEQFLKPNFNNEGKNTIKDLMKALYNLYKKKRKKHSTRYNLPLLTFLEYFPSNTTGRVSNFRRQHVFEAICKAMLVLDYDNNYWGEHKEFYKSLEGYVKSKVGKKAISKNEIWNESINESSAAGSVDIFFKIPGKKNQKEIQKKAQKKEGPPCEIDFNEEEKEETQSKDLFIMIQNKYFNREYSSANKYDVTKILSRAHGLTNSLFENEKENETKLILMVNNKQELLTKIKKNRNSDFELVPEDQIFGVEELNDWFLRMLYNMEMSENFDSFLKIPPQKKEDLQLRFHQKFFVNTTLDYLTQENEKKRKKFVWGAVPRSGKSYMIGGLIDRRKSNTIVIVLGAKSETQCQFVKMFKNFNNFKDYNIITSDDGKAKKKLKLTKKSKRKNIIILSQEKLKIKGKRVKEGEKNNQLGKKFWNEYGEFMPLDKSMDIYFDEIHKGGSTAKAQEQVLQEFNDRYTIDIFVMVTATYAKPTIAYSSVLDTHNPIILNWSYSDQQNMKRVSNEQIRNDIIESRDTIQKKQLENLFEDYEKRYQSQYLTILEENYKKNPELVILRGKKAISGNTQAGHELRNIHGNTFLLKCTSIAETKEQAMNPTDIFENNKGVTDLIDSIGCYEETDGGRLLSPKTLYGELQSKFNYDVINTRHTQLWFLPYNNLYTDKCDDMKIKNIKEESTGEEDTDEKDEKRGLPNIEPLSRGLVLNLLNNFFFKERFCFLIVHGQKLKYFNTGFSDFSDIFNNECVELSADNKNKGKSINTIIKEFEEKTFRSNKSLIILTGSMLRLGVSIPCADIAFNFDNIKSVDLNYQTMFRVLTERNKKNGKWKEYGYYYDFYPERAINFLYKYNQTYVDSFKKSTDMKQSVQSLQALLYLFNYDGLGVSKMANTQQTLLLYDNLIADLKLTEKDYSEYFIKNSVKSILSLLTSRPINEEILEEIRKKKLNLHGSYSSSSPVKIEKKGKKQSRALHPPDNNNKSPPPSSLDDVNLTMEDIAVFINDYTAILALFSDSNNYDCENIDLCITKVQDGTNCRILEEKLCECEREPMPVLACHMETIKSYSKKKFCASIDIFKKILEDNEYRNLANIIFNSIREAMGKSKMLLCDKTPEEMDEIIREYLPVKKIEKDKYGEVFTPPSLIREMLDKLPKAVWKNKNLKWLDPANGTGNFPMIVYKKLDVGLETVIPDKKLRSNHIIKNMLYMVELNEKNVAVSRKIFGQDANIACANFLTKEDKWKRKFDIDKFDIIIGNPPYNSGGIRAKTTKKVKRDQTQSKSIWSDFVKKSLTLLKNTNSYLLFIHPASWISLKSKNGDLITSRQLIYLRYYNYKESNLLFDNKSGKIPLTYYLMQNVKTKNATNIYDKCYKVGVSFNIYENNFVPTESVEMFKKIYNYTKKFGSLKDKSSTVRNSSDKMNTFNKSHPYPIINISNRNIILQFSSKNNDKNNDKKLILPNSSMGYPLYDKYGILYPASAHQFMLYSNNNEKELKQLQRYFYTSLIFYLINITKTSQNFFDNKVFEILPDITKMTSKTEITDEFLIHLFKLNKKDIICLEKYKKSGEGKLTLEKIKEYESFKITDLKYNNHLNATQIKYIQKMKLQSPRKTRKRRLSPSPSKKHTIKRKGHTATSKKHTIKSRLSPSPSKKRTMKRNS